ncbi:hypothetical protein LFM09_08130 [Lentzea alba]|uniref:hypothetical protein n=1 Tax=Lentzea alba TaxID=2714351 RepID=UPI0039BF5E3A
MKHGRGFFALSLLLVSAVAAPQAAAAETCQYRAQDLPVPEGARWARTQATSDDNKLILGAVIVNDRWRGVVWRDGELTQLAAPDQGTGHVSVKDINNSGVVVGGLEIADVSGEITTHAFRYRNGTYELLPVESVEGSSAHWVNDAGDVVGEVWDESGRRTEVWPADGPRTTLGLGEPVGISRDRKVVVQDRGSWPVTGSVIDLRTGLTTRLTGITGQLWAVDNDRLLLPGKGHTIDERDLAGNLIATYADGMVAYGKNNTGTLLGRTGYNENVLWQQGVRQLLDADKQLDRFYHGDVTDDGVLIGTYSDADWTSHPARWLRTCS